MCQVYVQSGDRTGNWMRIENACREAADGGAELVCFPEASLLGWLNPDAHQVAYGIPGRDSERLSDLARELDLFICLGLAEKSGSKLFDAVILVDNSGDILLKHRKINTLDGLMDPPYSKGSEVQVVETGYGKIGMLICADSFDEEILLKMKKHSPDLLLIPYGWAAGEEMWPGHGKSLESTIKKVAEMTGANVVGTNLVGQVGDGPWKGMIYGGQSIAVDRTGQALGKGKDRDRDIVIFKVTF